MISTIPKKQNREENKTNLELLRFHLDEPHLLHGRLLHAVLVDGKRPAQLLAALDKDLCPLHHGGVVGHGAVVALKRRRRLVALEPAARLERRKRLRVQRRPVLHRPDEPAHVDVVERVGGKGPGNRAVVDLAGRWCQCGVYPQGWGEAYNSRLGGTQLGCVGAMSVPMTEAEGYWSAKSLGVGAG